MTKASTRRRTRKSAAAAPAAALAPIGRAAIIASGDALPTIIVDVPEWGGQVKLRQLDAGARLQFIAQLRASKGQPDAAEALALGIVRAMLINEDGSPMFANTPADIAILKRSEPNGFTTVLAECARFANIGVTPEAQAKN